MMWKKILLRVFPILASPSHFMALWFFYGERSKQELLCGGAWRLAIHDYASVLKYFFSGTFFLLYTLPCLILFALSCRRWLRRPGLYPFFAILFITCVFLSPLGIAFQFLYLARGVPVLFSFILFGLTMMLPSTLTFRVALLWHKRIRSRLSLFLLQTSILCIILLVIGWFCNVYPDITGGINIF